jgi:anaerobic dimethyl sulfoxide reductase subunit B (iron-sulfur subunit)
MNPVCVDAAEGAMYKEPKYGAVLIDPDKATNSSLKAAWEACPYGAIVFESDAPTAAASKCTMCIDRLEKGLLPICVAACPQRALDFGKIEDLRSKYGTNTQLEGMPDPTKTAPAVVFTPIGSRKQLVPYDTQSALQLLSTSPNGTTKIFNSPSDVTSVPDGTVRRNKLMMKPTSVEELMYLTVSDND